MIVPCIDLMGGKVVQLVQGRDKALEGRAVGEMLEMFSGFPQIQVIDLDAAMGTGSNATLVEYAARRATIRAGGGVRSVQRAAALAACGVHRVIIGTAAFSASGLNREFLAELDRSIGRERLTIALDSKDGRVVVKGWKESTVWRAEDLIPELEPYCAGFLCTYVDKEGMMQGTDLAWFGRLRARTKHELTAAGGITTLDDIKALAELGIDSAIGMSIYTGRLRLEDLRAIQEQMA
jgi:phosphoribosylformimino-5-aminoimidazole carboxamide ribotide isomerase